MRAAANTASPLGADWRIAVYGRVSAAENRPHLERQAQRLVASCAAKGSQVQQMVREIGSTVNESRPKFLTLPANPRVTLIVAQTPKLSMQ